MSSHHLGTGGLQHYAATPATRSETRAALQTELTGRVIFDESNMLKRLRVAAIASSLVDECEQKIRITCADSIKALQNLSDAADRNKSDSLEEKADETKMYPHLKNLFDFISGFSPDNAATIIQPTREFLHEPCLHADPEVYDIGFPSFYPDFDLRRVQVPSTAGKRRPREMWRDTDGFGQVKTSSTQGPSVTGAGGDGILVQSAEYARLMLSACPFQLFTVGLLIFGRRFCVGFYDRGGIIFSPEYDLWTVDGMKTFIRIIRCLTCDLSSIELGMDPTVEPFEKTAEYLDLAREIGVSTSYPAFKVSMGGGDARRWITIGPPVWSSLSLFGRGTSIWRGVVERVDGSLAVDKPTLIMKNAWRNGRRVPESVLYQAIHLSHPGVASFHSGGDVQFPGPALVTPNYSSSPQISKPITVQALRACDGDPAALLDENSPTLHRLFLTSEGRSLWSKTSDLAFVLGFRDAVKGHQFLAEQGILHRDISAGNIMLSARPPSTPEGSHGFIMDLELASLPPSLHEIQYEQEFVRDVVDDPIASPNKQLLAFSRNIKIAYQTATINRGLAMSGTLQFMAYELLRAIASDDTSVKHCLHHDIESLFVVFPYFLFRRVIPAVRAELDQARTVLAQAKNTHHSNEQQLNNLKERVETLTTECRELESDFKEDYGRGSIRPLCTVRRTHKPFEDLIRSKRFSAPITQLLTTLAEVLVADQTVRALAELRQLAGRIATQPWPTPDMSNHRTLIEALDTAVDALKGAESIA
ncbi:hypothetical protein C8J56DRAFT_949223 [Mycena floridula]|nr:hypothetical protein C8J56DRAFT_949223 [Mycena floridula]